MVQIEGLPSGSFYPLGTTINKFIITDVNGNVDSCSFSVSRDSIPTVAVAGIDQNICVDTFRLAANVPSIGIGDWISTDASISFDDPTDANTVARGLSRGVNELIWTISNGACPISTDTLRITYDDDPTVALAGGDEVLCEENEITLSANNPQTGNGVWRLLSGTGNLASQE